ncbi:hypothetical protein [Rhizobium sp. RU36D]|uniref:hypothetical protein n=1 Tax=Rhizobium sp. RU36D TaxID=1907415 RepID=UPI001179A96C|nr:hypothetical protein [Rhizobium sp. RU36D]
MAAIIADDLPRAVFFIALIDNSLADQAIARRQGEPNVKLPHSQYANRLLPVGCRALKQQGRNKSAATSEEEHQHKGDGCQAHAEQSFKRGMSQPEITFVAIFRNASPVGEASQDLR